MEDIITDEFFFELLDALEIMVDKATNNAELTLLERMLRHLSDTVEFTNDDVNETRITKLSAYNM